MLSILCIWICYNFKLKFLHLKKALRSFIYCFIRISSNQLWVVLLFIYLDNLYWEWANIIAIYKCSVKVKLLFWHIDKPRFDLSPIYSPSTLICKISYELISASDFQSAIKGVLFAFIINGSSFKCSLILIEWWISYEDWLDIIQI